MKRIKSRLAALAACALLAACLPADLLAQGYGVQVYNPGVYNRTRQTMSNRAALKRKQERRRFTLTPFIKVV